MDNRGTGQAVRIPCPSGVHEELTFHSDCTDTAASLKRGRSFGVENSGMVSATCYKCGEEGHFSSGTYVAEVQKNILLKFISQLAAARIELNRNRTPMQAVLAVVKMDILAMVYKPKSLSFSFY